MSMATYCEPNIEIWLFLPFSPHFWLLNPTRYLHFRIFFIFISLVGEISQLKKRFENYHTGQTPFTRVNGAVWQKAIQGMNASGFVRLRWGFWSSTTEGGCCWNFVAKFLCFGLIGFFVYSPCSRYFSSFHYPLPNFLLFVELTMRDIEELLLLGKKGLGFRMSHFVWRSCERFCCSLVLRLECISLYSFFLASSSCLQRRRLGQQFAP